MDIHSTAAGSQRQLQPQSPDALIATNRFGMGAAPSEIDKAKANPQGWLTAQLYPPIFGSGLPSSSQAITLYHEFREAEQSVKQKKAELDNNKKPTLKNADNKTTMPKNRLDEMPPNVEKPREILTRFVTDSLSQEISSNNSVAWRLLDFFSNHFSVSTNGGVMGFIAPTLEREAIAPFLFGSFAEMLMAVETHPAMLVYLNNERSFGPTSKIAEKKHSKGLNENLAREILELHTLGVNSGYTQADVIEFAKAISGWSIVNPKEKIAANGFVFREAGHEPGKRLLLGKTYAQKGVEQGLTILQDLAQHPITAKHISFKLARYFINDDPPASLVDRLTHTWLSSRGNLKTVIIALINSPEAWLPERKKYKSPREFVISACRASGFNTWKKNLALNTLTQLGQRPFNAGSPAGFGDTAPAWDGADALQARIEWAAQVAARVTLSPQQLITTSLGDNISSNTLTAIKHAESESQGRSLLLLSPEFLRR